MIFIDIVTDGFFAAIAAIGFGAISDPALRSFKYIAFLAAIGHAFRYTLMTYCGTDIATASLFGALLIGFVSLFLGKRNRSPMTVLFTPALLPMIPGKFAYNMIFSQLMFLNTMTDPILRVKYLNMFLYNTMVTTSVIFMMVIGATLPMFLFPKYAFSLTRKKIK